MKTDGLTSARVESLKNEYLEEFDEEMKLMVAKIINLTIGKSAESSKFWELVVKPQIFNDYNYVFAKGFSQDEIQIGCLIQSFKHHFNIGMKEKMYEGFSSNQHISKSDITGFKVRSKSFSYQKHKLRQLVSIYQSHRDNKRYTQAMEIIEVKLVIEENLGKEQDAFDTYAEMADIYLLMQQPDKA